MQLFYKVGHGFAVKGDPEDPYQSKLPYSTDLLRRGSLLMSILGWCKEQSLRAMVDWFELWLVTSP